MLKFLYKRTILGRLAIQPAITIYNFCWNYIFPDKYCIKKRFKTRMGYDLDLDHPVTLNEKINWLKAYFRTPYHTICADKYAVRTYIKDKVGEEYLVPLYFMTKNPQDISPEKLPDEPCIVKTNHDSSGGIVIRNKNGVNWSEIQKTLKKRMKVNYYYHGKEWQYRDIEPCIIVEKLLKGKDGGFPFDYKLHCFNGKVNMIQVDVNRFSNNHFRNWYNTNWEREPYKWSSPLPNGKHTDPSPQDVERPATLEEMIRLSEIIAKDFVYVRVDWYDVEGQLYFGEVTFHHDGGSRPILPREWDVKLGNKLILPQENKFVKQPFLQHA